MNDMVLVLWGLLKQIYFKHVVGLLIIHSTSSSVRSNRWRSGVRLSSFGTFKSCTVKSSSIRIVEFRLLGLIMIPCIFHSICLPNF